MSTECSGGARPLSTSRGCRNPSCERHRLAPTPDGQRRSTLATMRLQPHEIEAIRTAVRHVFGPRATVRLFGSRARDDLRGGDIDLFVEVDPEQITIANEQRLRDRIAPAVEDLRVDIALHGRDTPLTAIGRIAVRDGILL